MRQKNSIKNILTTIIPYFILTLLSFFRVKVYLNTLGQDIYSLSQVFGQMFSYISIVEAGAGALVTQLYYRAIANKEKDEINIIYTSSKHTLRKIAAIILILGSMISFFLNYITNNSLSLQYMQIAFILYLIRSLLEYVMLSPRFVLQAHQKIYKINNLLNAYKVFEIFAEVVLLKLGVGYLEILVSTILIRLLSYYFTNKKILKEYNWLKVVSKDRCIKIKGMKNVFLHKISGVVYSNTDILLISTFLNTEAVTIYSSYNFIIKVMNDLSYMIASSIAPSLGNIMVQESNEKKINILEEINAAFFFMAMVITSSFYMVITPFINIWLGESLIIDKISLILILYLLFHFISNRPMCMLNEVNNLFVVTQKIAILEAAANLVLSVILINLIGMKGVLLATAIVTFTISFVNFPKIVYASAFKNSPKNYYYRYIVSLLAIVCICFISDQFITINPYSYFEWFINSLEYFLVVTIIMFVINWCISKYFRAVSLRGYYLIKRAKV